MLDKGEKIIVEGTKTNMRERESTNSCDKLTSVANGLQNMTVQTDPLLPSTIFPPLNENRKDNFFKTKNYDSYREKSVMDIILQYLTKPV